MIDALPAALACIDAPKSAITTWGIMLALMGLSLVVRSQLREEGIGKLQNLFELFMEKLCGLIREIVRADPAPYVPLVGTLFLFVFVSNLVGMIPGLSSPTGDLGVTSGLAVLVFLSVPVYGVRAQGWRNYLKTYVKPNPFLLPFNLLGEITRTLALAVRLFGNIMSGEFLLLVIIGVVTTVVKGYALVFLPFTFVLTLFLSLLSLITAAIQAFIFTVLALVYIGAAVEGRAKAKEKPKPEADESAAAPQQTA